MAKGSSKAVRAKFFAKVKLNSKIKLSDYFFLHMGGIRWPILCHSGDLNTGLVWFSDGVDVLVYFIMLCLVNKF